MINNLMSNIRVPLESGGDMWAQIAGTQTGEKRMLELIDKYGADVVFSGMEETIDHTERQVIAEVLKCPEGTWESEDFIDYDPKFPERGPVRVHAKMTIQHDPPKVIFDVTGSDPPTHSGMNGTHASSLRRHHRRQQAHLPVDTAQQRLAQGRRGQVPQGQRAQRPPALRLLAARSPAPSAS